MTLEQWVNNRETEYFTVSDDDGVVVYDARETEADIPLTYADMVVADVLFQGSDCPDVIITTAENMADSIRYARHNLSEYMVLAMKYGMREFNEQVRDAVEELNRVRRMAGK